MEDILCGVYVITNKINGHTYVGSSTNIKERWRIHVSELSKNKHHSLYLQRAWNKYGEEFFEFSIIEYCETSLLMQREQFYMNTLKPEYNIVKIAGRTTGYKHAKETIEKIVLALTGRNVSDETRQKIGSANKKKLEGRKLSDRHRQNVINGLIGRVRSEESKQKTSETLRALYADKSKHPMYGRKGDKHPSYGRTGEKSPKSKPVNQYNGDDEFVCRYVSILEAERNTGISSDAISNCLRKRSKTAGGFIWRYAEDDE